MRVLVLMHRQKRVRVLLYRLKKVLLLHRRKRVLLLYRRKRVLLLRLRKRVSLREACQHLEEAARAEYAQSPSLCLQGAGTRAQPAAQPAIAQQAETEHPSVGQKRVMLTQPNRLQSHQQRLLLREPFAGPRRRVIAIATNKSR
jgi:hypothetical protein